jgi:dCMP deaminase
VSLAPIPDPRPSWDDYYLELAHAVSRRADCTRRQVGAVVVGPDGRVVSTGYNGAPAGHPGCLTAGACPRGRDRDYQVVEHASSYDTGPGACIAVHAEANALLYGDATRYRRGTLYLWEVGPCDGCRRLITAAGLHRVVWPDGEWIVPAYEVRTG